MMDKEDYARQQEELARHAASEGAWYWNRFHTVTPLTLKRAHMFGFRKKTKNPEFTEICIMLTEKNAIAKFTADALSQNEEPLLCKVRAMQYLLMGASGHFIVDFHEQVEQLLPNAKKAVRGTNLDIIAIEAIIWLAFCSLKIWREDKESDPDAYKSIEGKIFYYAALWATMMISKTYEISAKNYLGYRWEYYSNGFKEAEDHSTLFPSVIFRSIGKKTFEDTGALDNPMATLNLDWIKMYMCANGYTIDRSNVPYSIFKSMVRGWRDLTGENVDEDSQFDDTD